MYKIFYIIFLDYLKIQFLKIKNNPSILFVTSLNSSTIELFEGKNCLSINIVSFQAILKNQPTIIFT